MGWDGSVFVDDVASTEEVVAEVAAILNVTFTWSDEYQAFCGYAAGMNVWVRSDPEEGPRSHCIAVDLVTAMLSDGEQAVRQLSQALSARTEWTISLG
jgi:hypothetical protein